MQVLKQDRFQSQVKWCYLPLNWTGKAPTPENNTWVQLLAHEIFDDEEALLLCQESEYQWVAWIPSQGEIRLDIGQFCVNP